MKQYKIECCIGNKKAKVKFANTREQAETEFDKFLNIKTKGEIAVFLLKNVFEDSYKVDKHQIKINS